MKILSFFSFLLVLSVATTPISSIAQSSNQSFTISVVDPVSGNNHSGTVQSITIHHEEQYSFWIHLDKTKEWTFTSLLSNQSLNEFLSEEEYLNVVRISHNGETAYLNNARRTKIQKTKNGYKVELSFKSIKY